MNGFFSMPCRAARLSYPGIPNCMGAPPLAAYESRWMPLEERYIRQCGPEKGCQLVIDTTEFFP